RARQHPLELGAHLRNSLARSLTSGHGGSARTICSRLSATRSSASGLRSLTSGLHGRRSRPRGGLRPPLQLLSATESRSDTPRLIRSLTSLPGSQLHSTDLGRLPVVHVIQQVEEIHLILIRHIHPHIVRNTVALDGELRRSRLHVLNSETPGLNQRDLRLPRHREGATRPQIERA